MPTNDIHSPDNPTPSVSIYDHFRGLIASGRLGVGERLPSVRQTALDLGVAPGTAARAYKQLERDGLVISRTGAGTRVATAASPLPRSVVVRIRELADLAIREHLKSEDILTALQAEMDAAVSPHEQQSRPDGQASRGT